MTTQTAVTTYVLDPVHSTAEFSVKHMMVSTVKGRFRELEATIEINEEDPTRSRVDATLQAASVDTGVEMRDNDLRSANFLDAARFPTLRFRSTAVEQIDGENWRVYGDLTIRDVTRPVVLETEFGGRGPDPWGNERVGFTAETSLNRSDFGLNYNTVIEAGGVVVGEKVKITLEVEAVRQK